MQDLMKEHLHASVHIMKMGSRKATPNPLEPIDEQAKAKMTNLAKVKSDDLIERLFTSRQKKIEANGHTFESFRDLIVKSSHLRGEDLVKAGLVDGLATYQEGKRQNHVDAKDLHLWVPFQSDPIFRGSHSKRELEGILATRFQAEY